MLIGVPKEIKADEYRVGLVPSAVRELVAHGHEALVEQGAGTGAGLADAAYRSAFPKRSRPMNIASAWFLPPCGNSSPTATRRWSSRAPGQEPALPTRPMNPPALKSLRPPPRCSRAPI